MTGEIWTLFGVNLAVMIAIVVGGGVVVAYVAG